MLGLSFEVFTSVHVGLSLVGIVAGLVAIIALGRGVWLRAWHRAFLVTTAATVITGFMFPIAAITPALVVGAVASVLLVVATIAFSRQCANTWATPAYVASAAAALYLNLFVLVAQSFMKVPGLAHLAPTQSEPPFATAQAVLLVAMITAGYFALRGSRNTSVRA